MVRTFGLGLLVFSIAFSTSRADVVVSLDMDPQTNGIQTQRSIGPGESFSVGVVMQLTGNSSLSAYSLSIRFDDDELDFVNRTETQSPLPEFNLGSQGTRIGINDPVLGIGNYRDLLLFDGVALAGPGPVAPAGPFTIATLNFFAAVPIGNASDIDIISGAFNGGVDDFVDNSNAIFTASVTFGRGSVSAVPEPSSWLFTMAFGLIACICTATRRKWKALKEGAGDEARAFEFRESV